MTIIIIRKGPIKFDPCFQNNFQRLAHQLRVPWVATYEEILVPSRSPLALRRHKFFPTLFLPCDVGIPCHFLLRFFILSLAPPRVTFPHFLYPFFFLILLYFHILVFPSLHFLHPPSFSFFCTYTSLLFISFCWLHSFLFSLLPLFVPFPFTLYVFL